MNERIIDLAKQCGDWSGQTIEMNDVGIAKFAQLIVRECAYVLTILGNAYEGSEDDADYMQGMLASADIIKEHFEAKEKNT